MKWTYLAVALLTLPLASPGADAEQLKSREQAEALIAALKLQSGTITLKDNVATLRVPDSMRFLDSHDAGVVLVKLWANPPQADPLGMLVPADCNLIGDCWGVIITYEEEGYVKDDDAEKINYTQLLTQMQKDIVSGNEERQKQGYPAIHLVGWATPPHYDRASHKLYWAKNLSFGNEPQNTLNYNVRVLGRRGVLVLNVVAGMNQLPEIEQATPTILSAVEFNPGNRYADFSAASGDKIAEYGIAALIAGGVAAKVGFFKGLWLLLLGAKKFVIMAVIAIGVWLRKLVGRKSPQSASGSAS